MSVHSINNQLVQPQRCTKVIIVKLGSFARILLCLIPFLTACTENVRAPVTGSTEQYLKAQPYYRIQRGDTLYSIAWRYKLDYKTLARWNNLSPPYKIIANKRLSLQETKNKIQTAAIKSNKLHKTPIPFHRKKNKESSERLKHVPKKTKRVVVSKKKVIPHKKKSLKSIKKKKKINSKYNSATSIGKTKKNSIKSWLLPTQGKVVSKFAQGKTSNNGVDIVGKLGQSIIAIAAGKVVYSGNGLKGYGRLIIVKHNKSFLSAYGHNEKLLVKEDDVVKKGQRIATMGSKDGNTPLLHFEIRRNGKPVDPLRYLN